MRRSRTAEEQKRFKILNRARTDPVFFAEHFLTNKNGDTYTLEEHQKVFLGDTYPYKIFFCSRRSGKSLSMSADILHKAFFRKNQHIAAIFPTEKQGKEFANNFNDIVFRSPILQSSFMVNNKMDKQLTNGTRIEFATAGTSSGKSQDSAMVGASVNTLYLDETQSLDEESLSTIIPIVSGQESALEIIMAGTPRGRIGFFYDNINNSKFITDVPNHIYKKEIEGDGKFSLHKFQITDVDDDDKVVYSKAPHRLPISELEVVKSIIGVDAFKREYCLRFQDDLSIPFYHGVLEKAGILEEPDIFASQGICCAGIDFGKNRNNSVLSVAVLNPNESVATPKWDALYFKSWELGTSYNSIIHFLNKVLPMKFPNLINLAVDATGVGNALVENIDVNNRFKVLPIIFSQPMKVSLVESTISNMESGLLRFYPHPKLVKELQQYRREITSNDRIIFKKGEADDRVDSFTMMNMAITDATQSGLVSRTNTIHVSSLGDKILNRTYGDSNLRQARRRGSSQW